MSEPEKSTPGLTAAYVVLFPFFAVLWGWALAVHWGWWVVPLGLPAISAAHAFGLGVAFSFVRASVRDKHAAYDIRIRLFAEVFIPLASLGLGWVAYQAYLVGY